MIRKRAIKKCKPTGKAKNFKSCSTVKTIFRFGMCQDCFKKWLYSTKEGMDYIKSVSLKAKKDVKKEKLKELREEKKSIRNKSYYEKKLEAEINEIVRLIDVDKGCISCEHGWDGKWTRQRHAGHRLSVGSFPAIRYNLFNIYLQCSLDNKYKSGNEREYDKGLIKHYGDKYLEKVMSLKSKYPELHLQVFELEEAIKRAREIKKEILSGKDFTREEINNYINIYK